MDSMRHLSTSLPRTRRRQDQSDLLTDFKAAALSVTNLYKSAAADQIKARSAGYQDALDDILAFLDKENLGLMDGEGWRVRQWATEQLVDESGARQSASEEEEDNGTEQVVDEARSTSPEVQRKQPSVPPPSIEPEDSSPRRISASEPPQQQQPLAVPSLPDFNFRSAHAYPPIQIRENSSNLGMDVDSSAPDSTSSPSAESRRLVVPRSARSKHNKRSSPSTINFNLGSGAGNKRRLPYPDFFDISGLNFEGHDKKDGGGGRSTKRGRHA